MKHTSLHILIATATFALLAATACDREHEKVVSTWEDGSPQLVIKYRGGEQHPIKTAETRFYHNGKTQYEKHYTGDKSTPDGTWSYYYDSGNIFATADFDKEHPYGSNWVFLDPTGNNFFSGSTDSIRVLELSEYETPATVCFYHDSTQNLFQFYSTCVLRSQGKIINGQREGQWQFFFANGQPQTVATFIGGKEEGEYIVYHENGIPFYRGLYREGHRTGTWEVYDEEANLVATQEY